MRIDPKKVKAIAEQQNLSYGEIRFANKLAEANIPVGYWFNPWSKFKGPEGLKDFVYKYLNDNIENRALDGRGFVLIGNYGVGKTQALTTVLKSALLRNMSAYYTTLPDLIANARDSEFLSKCLNSDFLAIDEVDSRHFSSSVDAQQLFGSMFERVIRHRTQNNLPTILATNNTSLSNVFTGQYSRVVVSLLAMKCENFTIVGKDQRTS